LASLSVSGLKNRTPMIPILPPIEAGFAVVQVKRLGLLVKIREQKGLRKRHEFHEFSRMKQLQA
jgi:hypothetical protein